MSGPRMRGQVIWDIRDARGLSSTEKSFLFVVESRGRMSSSASRAASDIGIGRTAFYTTRDTLIKRGLLLVEERPQRTTLYRVNADAVAALRPTHPSESSQRGRLTDPSIPGDASRHVPVPDSNPGGCRDAAADSADIRHQKQTSKSNIQGHIEDHPSRGQVEDEPREPSPSLSTGRSVSAFPSNLLDLARTISVTTSAQLRSIIQIYFEQVDREMKDMCSEKIRQTVRGLLRESGWFDLDSAEREQVTRESFTHSHEAPNRQLSNIQAEAWFDLSSAEALFLRFVVLRRELELSVKL